MGGKAAVLFVVAYLSVVLFFGVWFGLIDLPDSLDLLVDSSDLTGYNLSVNNRVGVEPNIEKIVECNYDFRDYNGDVLVMSDGSVYVVNYNMIHRFQVVGDDCVYRWGKRFQSDDQQIASDGRYLWVSSRSHNVVGRFDLEGRQVSAITDVDFPMGLGLREGYLYVVEFEGSMRKYDTGSGRLVLSVPLGEFNNDVAVDSRGNIFILRSGSQSGLCFFYANEIVKYSSDGRLLEVNPVETKASTSIVVDGNDNVFVMDSDRRYEGCFVPNMVRMYSPGGVLLGSWKVDGYVTSFTLLGDRLFIAYLTDDRETSILRCVNITQ